MLALVGIDTLVEWMGTGERGLKLCVVVAALLVLSYPTADRFGQRLGHLADNRFAVTATDREWFQIAEWRPLEAHMTTAARLDSASARGDVVVVWDDPLILLLAERRNGIAINGWSPEHLDQRLWRRAEDEMRSVRPDLVLVGVLAGEKFDERAPSIMQFLDEEYEAVAGVVEGEAVLYRLAVH
jgi:hypothetical protein